MIDKLVLNEVYIADHHNDTLIYVKHLKTGLTNFSADETKFNVGVLKISEAKFFLKQYKGESSLNLNIWIDKLVSDTTESSKPKFEVTCDKVDIENLHFVYVDKNEINHTPNGINYVDIDATNIDLVIKDLKITENIYSGNINRFSLTEKSGLVLKNLAAKAFVDTNEITLNNLALISNNSKIDGDLKFRFKNGFTDWLDFNDKVKLDVNLNESQVSFQDIAYFAPALKDVKEVIRVEGQVKNQVNKLKSNGLKISFGSNSFINTNFKFKDLTNPDETFVRLEVEELTTNESDISKLKFLEGNQPLAILSKIKKLGQISFKGNITGFYNDLVAYGDLNTQLGALKTDVSLKSALNGNQLRYSGKLQTNNFNVGKLAEVNELGNVAFNLKVNGNGVNEKTLKTSIKGTVNKIEFNNFTYKNVELKGVYDKQLFDGTIKVNQPEVDFDFIGKANLKKGTPKYDFNLNAKAIDLAKLNLSGLDSISVFKGNLNCNLIGETLDDVQGEIIVSNLYFSKNETSISLDDLKVNTTYDKGYREAIIKSDLVNGDLKGNFTISNVASSLTNQFKRLIPDLLTVEEGEQLKGEYEGEKLTYDFELNNTHKIFDVFYPDLHMANNSRIHGEYDTEYQTLELLINSEEVKYQNNRIQNFYTNAFLSQGILDFTIGTTKLLFDDSLWIDDVNLNGSVYSDTLGFSLDWENRNNDSYNGDVSGFMLLSPLPEVNMKFESSQITIADTTWQIQGKSEIIMVKDSIVITDLNIYNKHQSLIVNGKLSSNSEDKLHVNIKNLDLNNFNIIMPKDAKVYGIANGKFELSNLLDAPVVEGDLNIVKTGFNEHTFGELGIKTKWNNSKKLMTINGSLKNDTTLSVRIYGNYTPFDKAKQLDMGAKFYEFPLQIVTPYISDFVERVEGSVSGKLSVKGMVKEPKLKGNIKLNNTALTYKMLGTRYVIDDDITILSDKIVFKNVHITDTLNNKGYINGEISHNDFSDFNLDLKIRANKLLALNTTQESEELYYGTAFATGNVFIKGTPDELEIDVKAKSEAGTQINLPIEDESEAGDGSFVIFINKADTLDKPEEQKEIKGLKFTANLEVTPDAELQLILDPKVGDIMKGRGNGNLRMELTPLGDFTMHGDFEIDKGTYLFTLQNLINKKFEISEGSRVTWSGDPLGAKLNIETIYNLRANPKDLFVGTVDSALYTKKVPVECILKLTDGMLNPTVDFDIGFANTDPELRQKATTIIQNSRDVNKQVFSLLLLNRFITPTTNSGVIESGLTATTDELLSNQLSHLLSQFSDVFEIGVIYESGDETTEDKYGVQFSTTLLKDRLTLDASAGNTSNNTGASEIVGDFNVEYKLSKDGRTKVKAFQRSNDYELLDQSSIYTRGVGLSYQKGFNKFSDFFRRKNKNQKNP